MGYLSSDGRYAHCGNANYAGNLPLDKNGNTYPHRLDGPCGCGVSHLDGAAAIAPIPTPRKRKLHTTIVATLSDGSHKTAEWQYLDADGNYVYSVVRYDHPKTGEKTYLPWQPVGLDWAMDEQGLTRLLYRLPELKAAPLSSIVWIAEGEKCTEALRGLGLVATCSPGGAKKWHTVPDTAGALRGRHVIILPDNDQDGRDGATQVASSLDGVAASVRLLALPGLPEKGDVADWLAAGGTKEALYELALTMAETPVKSNIDFTPPSPPAIDETFLTQHRSMNEKLLWIFETLATPEEIMPISKRVTLIMARRNAEWRVVAPESPEESKIADAGYTPDYYEALGKAGGMSDGTAAKNLKSLAEDYGLVRIEPFREIKDGIPLPRISYSIEPTKIASHREWMPKDGPRAPRGGKREGAGRPKQCPTCGSERITQRTVRELVERITVETFCEDCSEITRQTLSEQSIGKETIAEREINNRFHDDDAPPKCEATHPPAPLFQTAQSLVSR